MQKKNPGAGMLLFWGAAWPMALPMEFLRFIIGLSESEELGSQKFIGHSKLAQAPAEPESDAGSLL